MANILPMAKQSQIKALSAAGWSQRRIAKHLGLNRRTVRRYLTESPKCTISTAGSESESEDGISSDAPDPVINQPGRRSECEPFRNFIVTGIEKGSGYRRLPSPPWTEEDILVDLKSYPTSSPREKPLRKQRQIYSTL